MPDSGDNPRKHEIGQTTSLKPPCDPGTVGFPESGSDLGSAHHLSESRPAQRCGNLSTLEPIAQQLISLIIYITSRSSYSLSSYRPTYLVSVPGLVGSFRNDRDKLRRSPGVRKLMAYVAPCRRRDDPPQAATRCRPESGLARSRYATATVLVVHPCCAPAHSVAYRKVIVIIHDDLGRVGCTENRYCRMVRGLTGPRTPVSRWMSARWLAWPSDGAKSQPGTFGETPEVSTHCLVHGPRNGSIAA